MCVSLTQGPTASPASLPLPGTVIISLTLQSASSTTVTITCSVNATLDIRTGTGVEQSVRRIVQVNGSTPVSVMLQLEPTAGDGRGAHMIAINITEPTESGCPPIDVVVGVTGI